MKFPLTACLGFACLLTTLSAAGYDPLKVPEREIISQTFEAEDAGRDRVIPLRIYQPASRLPAPVVLFSHGLGGARDNNPHFGNHWAKRGYIVVFIQHPGSDENVWKDAPKLRRLAALKDAASGANLVLRARDVSAVLDTLELWNDDEKHDLHKRFDLHRIGMSGHSFGAVTTQAVAGQKLAGGRVSLEDSRIKAAVMMSPSAPMIGDPAEAFAAIRIPCLLMTGTLDNSPIGNTRPEDRLNVFPHLVRAPAWQIVFDKGTHMSFSDRDLLGRASGASRYATATLALTTAFWDACLREDKAAAIWLNGPDARTVLLGADQWQKKTMAGSN
jgi:predicted dienelactone hydrolase